MTRDSAASGSALLAALTEQYQLHPEQSTSAIIVHHPEAKYFAAR